MSKEINRWLFEGHIAIPQVSLSDAHALLQELQKIGIENYDYFLSLLNLPYDGQPCRIDPTTHDIDNPMIITTSRFHNYKKAAKTILTGMAVLQNYGIKGNFELEAAVDDQQLPALVLSINDFPGFSRAEGSPKFENHIMWEGSRDLLPTIDTIVQYHLRVFGYSPNQVAEFGLVPGPTSRDTIWRVSTVYQPTREAALNFAHTANANKKHFLYPEEIITEQICVVSEPLRD